MTVGANNKPAANGDGTDTPAKPLECAISLPHIPGTRIHLRLTISESTVMLFLTSASMDARQGGAAMGSFVYAIPNVRMNVAEQ